MSTILPNTYQRVYYVQSSGTQWLDTGHKHTNNSSYELIMSFYTAPTQTYYKVFGAATSNYSSTDCIQLEADNNEGAFHFRAVWYSEYGKNFGDINLTSIYRILMNNSSSVCYDYSTGKIIGSNTYTGSTASASKSDYLFTVNSSETSEHACSCRIYSFKIYSSGKLVCNLVPCYRKSDGVIGMYDLVNDSFKTNIGSGTFTKGDDLNDLTYKNFKLYLGRRSETHEEWKSHTVNDYAFEEDVWLQSYAIQYKHYKRKLLGASDNIRDASISSYFITDFRGLTPSRTNCTVVTDNGNTYIEISFMNNSSLNPIGYTLNASYTYSTKESTIVYIPESYKTIILGDQIFNIKSDVDIVPIVPIVPSINDISLSYSAGLDAISVKATNSSKYNIEVNLASTTIDTSSTSYYDDDFYSQGYIISPLPARETNYEIAYFSDATELYRADITLEFVYNGTVIGSLSISYEE